MNVISAPTPPRTIAVDLTPLLPGGENGGAKVFAIELVRRLARLAPGTEFVLLTQAASHAELAALDARNVRRLQVIGPATASMRSRGFAWAASILERFPAPVRRWAARVGYAVHVLLKRGGSRGPLEGLGAGLLFCPFTAPTYRHDGVPTVCTLYDVQFRAYPQFFSVEDAVQRERAFTDACRFATALAAISGYTRDAAIAAGGLDVGRIRTIPLRLAKGPGSEAGNPPGEETVPAPGYRYLLYPANFWRHKNHEMLLTAFALARGAGLDEDVRLVCTGAPGARQQWLERAARGMGLADRVIFPGFIPDREMAAMLARATAVVFPSLYEGFGLPVTEAMAAGVPVGCGNTTALPEVAGDAALLFDPRVPAQIAAAMVSLVKDEALRHRLIEAGRRRALEFTDTDRMAGEYLALFGECA